MPSTRGPLHGTELRATRPRASRIERARLAFVGQGGPTEFPTPYTPCARNEKCGWDPPFLIPAEKF
jgi:hypothetical protein